MNQIERTNERQTAVEDVRRVREKIAAQHRGNLRKHMEETNRIVAEYREKLGLKASQSPPAPAKPDEET